MRTRISQRLLLLQPLVASPAAKLRCQHSPYPRVVSRYFSSSPSRREESARKWSTPLAKQLFDAISITGPVPLASYMRMCLTGDVGGYYTGAITADAASTGEAARDQFGKKGDFITSPEISQVFGELLGVWFIAEWMSQGRPSEGVQIIEVGPGRGTLMDDMLRTIQRFPAMAGSIEHIFMVEASKELQLTQRDLLCGKDAASTDSDGGSKSVTKYGGKPITWTDSIKSIPIDPRKTPFIVAHEFFDALPIHSFQTAPAAPKQQPSTTTKSQDTLPQTSSSTTASSSSSDTPSLEWREMMVAPVPPTTSDPSPSPEFQLILSPSTTRHSRFLPQTSPRYHILSTTPSSIIEVCPDASIYATDFASRIGGTSSQPKPRPSGAALILDYGTATSVPANSLRGIRFHKLVNPFSEPGLVDLSADVDFTAIADIALDASEGVEVHGPVEQADFLEAMGIRERAGALVKKSQDEETKNRMETAWKRLVDRGEEGMGRVYKALAIVPENGGRRRPVGFGGDVGGS